MSVTHAGRRQFAGAELDGAGISLKGIILGVIERFYNPTKVSHP
jgi:hypothetical protein